MTTFKAMTQNVANLFRPDQDATEEQKERYQEKLRLLAGVIGQLSPDVVALEEVGGDGALEDLQAALDVAYPHREVSAFPDGRGIRVGFLSKHEVEEKEVMVEFPEGPALDINDISSAQVAALLEAAREDSLEALYVVALHTGLRRGELLALRWNDVDFVKSTLRVGESLQQLFQCGWSVSYEGFRRFHREVNSTDRVCMMCASQYQRNPLQTSTVRSMRLKGKSRAVPLG